MQRPSLPVNLQFSLMSWLCFSFLFLNALPRTTAATNILIGAIVLGSVTLAIRRQLVIDWKSPITQCLLAFGGIALLSSFVSPYWEESIKPIRRELLPFLAVYFVLVGNQTETKTREQLAKATLWSLSLSYAARIVLAIMDWSRQGFNHDSYTINREAAPFVDFFAINSPLFLPLLITILLYWKISKAWQAIIIFFIIIGYILIGIAGVRTALLCAVLVGAYQITPFLWKKKFLVLGCVAVLSVVSIIAFKPQLERAAPKYATIFIPSTYKENGSIVERYAIWRGTLEMVNDRPLLGYGLGWKKLHDIAYSEGYYDRWKARNDWLDEWGLRYFDTTGYGGTNPHNLFVQILFETGAFGLVTYMATLISLGLCAFRLRKDAVNGWIWPCASASLLAYFIVNLMNGIWLTSGATLGLLVATELLRQSQMIKRSAAAS